MDSGRVITGIAIVLAVTAATLCEKLLSKHITGASGSAWFDAGCTDKGVGGGADCAAVLASPYSYWPPKKANDPPNRPHIPVAFLGLVYYSVLALWLIGIGRPSRSRRWLHVGPLLLVGFGLAGSAYFMYVMLTRLNEWCPWCVVTHALNLGLAVCLVLMWPRKDRPRTSSAPTEGVAGGGAATVARIFGSPAAEAVGHPARTAEAMGQPMHSRATDAGAIAHPSVRLAAITVVAVVLAAAGAYHMYGKIAYGKALQSYKQGLDQCVAAVERLKSDTDALVESWEQEPRRTIPVDADDPFRLRNADTPAPYELVVFSDFECPSCRKFALFLEREVEPLFGGNLRTVFKHYPLNGLCNPATQTMMHAHACEAAQYAEAARVIGGNAAFWAVHDHLFLNQEKLKAGEISVDSVAQQAKLDPKVLHETMKSEAVLARIKKDGLEARNLGVGGTPLPFLAGRRLDNIARDEIKFWDRIADRYWKSRGEPRPEPTKLLPRVPTPGTPNPTNGR